MEHFVLIKVRLGLSQILPKHKLLQATDPSLVLFESHQSLVFVASHHHELCIENIDGLKIRTGAGVLGY